MIIFLSDLGPVLCAIVDGAVATRSIDETMDLVRRGGVECIFSDVGKVPEGNGSGYRLLQAVRREKSSVGSVPVYLMGDTDGGASSGVCAKALGAAGLISRDVKSVAKALGFRSKVPSQSMSVEDLTEGLREYIGPATDLLIGQITEAPDMLVAAAALIECRSDRDAFVRKLRG
jgi:hypothetical protein